MTVEAVDIPGAQVEVDGSSFTVTNVLPQSVFRLRISSPTHAVTLSALIEVGDDAVADLVLSAVSSSLIDSAYAAAGTGPSGGVIVARLVDGTTGEPVSGVTRDAIGFGDATVFLDSTNTLAPEAPASTASGVGIALNVPEGLVEIVSSVPEHVFIAPIVRVESDVASVVDIEVGLEPPPLPANMDFESDILPVFDAQGCNNCHQGSGDGKIDGGFSLNGSPTTRYDQVMLRVDLDNPEDSLFLRKPSFEDPPDGHQIVFANQYDPDFMKMRSWVLDGAPR